MGNMAGDMAGEALVFVLVLHPRYAMRRGALGADATALEAFR